MSFVIACVLTLIVHAIIAGSMPGAAGIKWWDVVILFLMWGAVDAAIKAIKGKSP